MEKNQFYKENRYISKYYTRNNFQVSHCILALSDNRRSFRLLFSVNRCIVVNEKQNHVLIDRLIDKKN